MCLLGIPGAASNQPPDLAETSKRATDAMAAGKYDEAAAIYSQLSKARPADAGILMNLGMARTMAGRAREAIAPLERAVKLDPALHPAWLFLGTAYLDIGKPASAVGPLEKALVKEPDSLKARQMLAETYLKLERHGDAARELARVIEIDPDSATAWYGLGQTHEARAQIAFDRLRQIAPDSPYESLLVADVLASDGRYDEAVERYRAVIEKRPQLPGVREAIADVYEQVGNTAAAAAERSKAQAESRPDCVRQKPACEFLAGHFAEAVNATADRSDAPSLYWRARAHNELAVEAFSRLEQLPPSPESHTFRARLYRQQDRHLDSVAELEKAVALAPGDRAIRKELATSLYLARNYEQAAPLLKELLRDDPSSTELKFMYGDTLLQAQNVEAAIPLLESAVSGDPASIEVRESLARAYLLQGRYADAIPHLKAALSKDEDGSLHYQLARAYQATGQLDLAKRMMARYQELLKGRK
jgi:predicted Zn-dependent protease